MDFFRQKQRPDFAVAEKSGHKMLTKHFFSVEV
jgi:hypothetical protein